MLNNLRRIGAAVAVDVGAAGGLQPHWIPFASDLDLVLIEPDIEACRPLEDFLARHGIDRGRCRIVNAAVGRRSEVRCLYVSNARTGSSLFPFKRLDQHRDYFENLYTPEDYVFPVQAEVVSTVRFGEALSRLDVVPNLIKLDTQGSELEILQGMDEAHWDGLCSVEVEIGTPGGYIGSCSVGSVATEMEQRGFQLMDMRMARGKPLFDGGKSPDLFPTLPTTSKPVRHRIWEIDAVFIRDPMDVLARRDAAQVARLVTTLAVYRLFNEALAVTGRAEALGILDATATHGIRQDLQQAYDAMCQLARRGYDNCWDSFT